MEAKAKPTSSGNARTARSVLSFLTAEHFLISWQREHSANIKEAPKSYQQMDTPKAQNIITIDGRGLEFVEFKADV